MNELKNISERNENILGRKKYLPTSLECETFSLD